MHGDPAGLVDVGERSFDHYARLVRRFLGVQASSVSLVGDGRHLLPGADGLGEPLGSEREVPLSHSTCRHVVAGGAPLVVEDTQEDHRTAGSPAVEVYGVRSYAGWPLVDAAGRTIGALCAIGDAPREWTDADLATLADLARACSAEIQHAAADVAEHRELTRAIVAAADVAMVFYDEDHRLVMANRLAEEVAATAGFRLDEPPYAGSEVWRSDRRRAVPAEEQLIPRALRGELRHHEVEWFGAAGPDQIAVTASARLLERPGGGAWGTLVVIHDVTDLARALEVQERFSATVSHELRTPLTAILGYVELLTDDLASPRPSPAGLLAAVQRIDHSAQSLRRRINDLLESAQRGHRVDLHATDLAALAARTVEMFASQAEPAGVGVTLEPGPEQWVVADAARVEQAVENLVSNGIKYTPRGGRVEVRLRGTDDVVRIDVGDDGIGMSEAEVRHAFELNWRAAGATARGAAGLGIGLSLVREIALEHHGDVSIASEPGAGTTVTLTLPRAAAADLSG